MRRGVWNIFRPPSLPTCFDFADDFPDDFCLISQVYLGCMTKPGVRTEFIPGKVMLIWAVQPPNFFSMLYSCLPWQNTNWRWTSYATRVVMPSLSHPILYKAANESLIISQHGSKIHQSPATCISDNHQAKRHIYILLVIDRSWNEGWNKWMKSKECQLKNLMHKWDSVHIHKVCIYSGVY